MEIRHRNNFLFLLIAGLFILVDIRLVKAQNVAALQPEQVTIIQYIINERPVLVSLLTTAGLVPVLSGDSPYTLLAPPEQALAALKNESPDKIREVLSGYVLKGKYLETDLKDGASVETLSGKKLKVCRKDGTLLNGVKLIDTNQTVRNGVVHQLQDLLK